MKTENKMKHALISELATTLSREIPTDRSSFVARIKNHLDGELKKTIDSHNTSSVIFVLENQGHSILLKAELGKNTATHKEVEWYEHLAGLELDGTTLYLGATRSEDFALLLLRYIDRALTLDEWAVENPAKARDFSIMVSAMLDYDSSLFHKTARLVPRDLIEQSFTRKYRARRKEAARAKYLDGLLSNRSISINGENFLTPDFALKKLMGNSKLWQWLMPEQVGFVHGDLHTGNVLIGNGQLYFVDPNGDLEMPLEYDIAKLLHSVHGQYPVIMRGGYDISSHKNDGFEFDLKKELIYSAAYEKLRHELDYEQYIRSMYIEALHFVTMLPHHAKNRSETTALFLRSTQLFGELFSILGLSS